ncbi:MAG TPA: alpha/beta hydrolase [Dehalococcoidia bacterium]|nr:alpha/beta hydrolase [Dehalococcoidia bacterium]
MEIIKDSYFTTGVQKKPSLVLIHGLASNKFTWNAIIEILKDDYYLIAVDLPGHGSNSIYETDFSYSSMVDYLFKLQSHLGISFQYIAGHSYGASIATITALDKRFKIKKLALLDGGVVPLKSSPDMNDDNYMFKLAPPDFTNRKFESISEFIDNNLSITSNPYSDQIKHAILSNFDHAKKPFLVPFLERKNHLKIVDYLWNYNPELNLSKIRIPTLGLMACKFDTIDEKSSHRSHYASLVSDHNNLINITWVLNTPHDLQLYAPKLVSRKLIAHFKS